MRTEHEIFQSLSSHVAAAASDCRHMAHARPDQPWVKAAEKLEELGGFLAQMVGDGFVKGFKQ